MHKADERLRARRADGLADDARGQAGGLSRDDQVRLGRLALRAWSEVEILRSEVRRLRAFEDEIDVDERL